MNRLLKSLLAALSLLTILPYCLADTLVHFDNPLFHALNHDGKVYGFFSANVRNSACKFWFIQTGISGKTDIAITTYETDGSFDARSHDTDFDGDIRISGNRWKFHADNLNAGCTSSAGAMDFTVESTDAHSPSFKVIDSVEATGVGILVAKHQFYDVENGVAKQRKGYLVQGDIVVILKQDKAYSYIEFTNPGTLKRMQAWIASDGIVSPLPATKALKK